MSSDVDFYCSILYGIVEYDTIIFLDTICISSIIFQEEENKSWKSIFYITYSLEGLVNVYNSSETGSSLCDGGRTFKNDMFFF